MKIGIVIFCVSAQVPYLGKIIVLEIWTKMFSASQTVVFLNQIYLQNKLPFFFVFNSKIFWVGMVKNGCGQSGHGTLKLTVSQE